jgi:DNA-directed RNA polymerase specialized sigma24 family protein
VVELSNPNENNLDKILRYKCGAKLARNIPAYHPNTEIESQSPTRYISEEGETVARAIRQEQKRLTADEAAQIAAAYRGGKSTYAIAEAFGCDRKTVCAHLKAQGIAVSQSKVKTEEELREMITLYERGQTMTEIAKLTGISASSIQSYLKKNGVRMRGRWGR